jgi:hypothetical protein
LRLLHVLFVLVVFVLLYATYSRAQSAPEPIPGVHITNGSIPWAVDTYEGKRQVVPIHHTTVELNSHKGANIAGSLAGNVFYKPKMTIEVKGAHARVALHTDKPIFYVQVLDDPGGDSDNPAGNLVINRATINQDRRIFSQTNFTQLTGNAKRRDLQVDISIEKLADGWLRIVPKAPLAPGEYALQPVPKAANTYSTVVFDFTIDVNAPNAPDALSSPTSSAPALVSGPAKL